MLTQNPQSTLVYAEHAHPVTVARIAPSGFYAASGDTSGLVRVWDLASGELMLKLQTQALSGKITDLQWDGESKRIIAVGDGRERFGHAFLFDSGSSVGEISGHSKPINAVAIRRQRPFRAVTAGDDTHVVFYTGVPFKYSKTLSGHTRFVQDVAYAADGSTFASCGSDGKVLVYDGQSGDQQQALGEEQAHNGTVYGVSYAPDSKHLATAGADGLVKVWHIEDGACIATWDATERAATKVDAQLVGLVWAQPQVLVAVGLGGALYVLDFAPGSASLEARVLFAPTKGISSLAYATLRHSLAAGSYDGRVYEYTSGNVSAEPLASGAPSIVGVAAREAEIDYVSLDDALRRIQDTVSVPISLTAQPRSIAVTPTAALVASEQGIDVVTDAVDHHSAASLQVGNVTAVGARAGGDQLVAVGTEDAKVHLFADWKRVATLENGRSTITALAFSPDGALLAAGESSGKVLVYDVKAQSVRPTSYAAQTLALGLSLGPHCGARVERRRNALCECLARHARLCVVGGAAYEACCLQERACRWCVRRRLDGQRAGVGRRRRRRAHGT